MRLSKRSVIFTIFGMALLVVAFTSNYTPKHTPESLTPIPAYPQRDNGDSAKGWDYVRYGSYIGAGVPYNIFKLTVRGKQPNYLQREGKSAKLPHMFNLFTEKGVDVVGGLNCFGCHSGMIEDQFIPGLGDWQGDFTNIDTRFFKNFQRFARLRYGKKSVQYQAYLPLARGAEQVNPYLKMPFMGLNPAFALEEAAVAHRNPTDLTWTGDEMQFPLDAVQGGADVPPLWNVKKKNALYYNGMGRGDFTKLLMQVMVVAIEDSTEARTINDQFHHVLAWLKSIQPPKYPKAIDKKLAEQGQAIFEDMCSGCHGFYAENDEDEDYPNLLVGLDVVKTDSTYALYAYRNENFTNWLNSSWIMTSEPKAWVQPELGYVAPPLDGVWATAPYLHNGSVPNLATLLNSTERPTYWRRTFDSKDYDYKNVGWKYETTTKAKDKFTYNTTLTGYGNYGHYFGDVLNDPQRTALIEYLKTL